MSPKTKKSKAAKKGWETRAFNRRSKAARKGWRTRKRKIKRKESGLYAPSHGIFVRMGYDSSKDNSYEFVIEIVTYKRIRLKEVGDLCSRLIGSGYFGQWYDWATFNNVVYADRKRIDYLKKGHAQLIEFNREAPEHILPEDLEP